MSLTGAAQPKSWPGCANRGPAYWPPSSAGAAHLPAEASDLFLGQLDPGIQLGTVEEWMHLFSGAGLTGTQTAIGPFAITTARGLLSDEGFHAVAVIARMTTQPTYLRKMAWLMPRMARAVPYLGSIVVAARKPRGNPAPTLCGGAAGSFE